MIDIRSCARYACFLFSAALLATSSNHSVAQETFSSSDTARLHPDELVQWVLEQNPGLDSIEEAALAAAMRIETKGVLDDPVLSYSIAPETVGDRRFDTGQRIELSQKIPWPGELSAQTDIARAESRAVDATVEALRLSVMASTKAAFAEWYFIHEALRINRENQAVLRDLRAIAESRLAAGRGLQQDVYQAEIELALLEDQYLALSEQRTSVQSRLNRLMNRLPDAEIPLPAPLSGTVRLPPLQTLIDAAISHHPELLRLEALLAARSADLDLASVKVYPDLRLSGGYNSLWDADEKRFTVGFSVGIPLDQSWREAAIDAARADRKRAEWDLIDLKAALLEDLATAYAATLRALESATLHAEKLLPLAQRSLEATVSEYRSGAGDFLAVVTAERHKLKTEQSLARAIADRYRNLAALERSVGEAFPNVWAISKDPLDSAGMPPLGVAQ